MDNLYKEIEEILEEYVRPQLREHSGDVQIADIREGTVYVRLLGHCSGCPSAKYTLESQVKEEILEHSNQVTDVKLQEEVSQELYDFAKAILEKRV
ncbi:MAG: NifU family protein [Hespellia sp.]|nr:NifU family protein [Hespellia sp.]